MTNAAIYARLSQDRTGTELGVTRQLAECRALAQKLSMTIVAEYVENDTSATSGKVRPEFERLLASKPEAIIAWHQDRLLRLTADLERVIRLDVPIYTVTAGTLDLTNPAGRAVARTVAAWSTYEGEQRNARMVAERRQGIASGKDMGGRRVFGFEPDRLTIRESEARLIRDGCRMILAGASLREVARTWNAAKVREDLPFRASAVHDILVRPRNAGRLLIERRNRDREVIETLTYNGTARPAILSIDEFEAMTAILASRPKYVRGAGLESEKWSGVGLVRCSVCKGRLEASKAGGGIVVRCSGRGDGRRHPGIRAHLLEHELAVGALLGVLDRLSDGGEGDAASPEIQTLQIQIATLRKRLEQTATDYDADLIDATRFNAKTTKLKAELRPLEVERDRLLAGADTAGAVELAKSFASSITAEGWHVADWPAIIDPWIEHWRFLEAGARRRLLRGLYRELYLMPADRDGGGRVFFDGAPLSEYALKGQS